MPRVRHSSNAARPRVRLISTPTNEGTDPMSTVIEGVRFSDQLGALLDHAAANGFRIEPDSRGGKGRATGIVVYAPDKTIPPISVTERGAKFNKPHYENIRRDLYHAGCPPLPSDTKTPNEEPLTLHIHDGKSLNAALEDDEERANILGVMVGGLFDRNPRTEPFSSLIASLAFATAKFADDFTADMANTALERARDMIKVEIDEALKLASDAEAEATRLRTALDRADAALAAARSDCAAALRRAEAAEAQAAELESAIAPLRAILGKS